MRSRAITALLLLAACSPSNEIATHRVEPVTFVRRVTAEGTLKPVKATPVAVPENVQRPMKVAWLAEDGARLRKGDVIVQFDSTEFENLLLVGQDDRTTAGNRLIQTSAEATATRTNLRRDAGLAQSELEAARRFKVNDDEVFSRNERIESSIDESLASHRKTHAEEVLGVRDNLVRVERDLISIEDRKAGLKIQQAEDALQKLRIVAPHDGILVLQRNWRGEIPRAGDTLWRGQPIGEIPDLAGMEAEVFVLEADAAGLAVDQKATLFVESNPQATFKGTVKSVDKVARPRIPRQPVQYFGVRVALEKTDPALMKPGARVRGILEVESQANAFAIPRQALFEKNGRKIVYRKSGDGFVPVAVTVGSSTAGRVVVTKGLVRGDEIALEDPKQNEIEEKTADGQA